MVKRDDDPDWVAMRWPLFISLGLGASWISVAHQSAVFATIQIWAMLVFALIALWRAPRFEDLWTAQVPVALYAGWLTAASFVSLALCLGGYGIGPSASGWALIGLILLPVVALVVLRGLGYPLAYGAAVIWALAGIAAANIAANPALTGLALTGAVALGLHMFLARRTDA